MKSAMTDSERTNRFLSTAEFFALAKARLSLNIAEGLNDQGIPTARGGKWSSPQVMRMLERLDPFREEEAA
jgi:hypothetical protein